MPDGIGYTSNSYDLTNLGYDYDTCNQGSIVINPKLTKSYSYCFEVLQEYRTFDLSIRNTDFDDCDSRYIQCSEYLLNISNPNFIALNKQSDQIEESVPIEEPTTSDNAEPESTQETKTFSFVDPQKDPWSYVDRYNNEPEYKKWFDENFPDMTIYDAVGLEKPEIKEQEMGQCGPGTILADGVCTSDESQQDGGCLIATATYGSELAPQVQQLRELRDNSLLQTASGTSFMTGFNQFYYSFSPTIADWERENPAFKEFVKITLTPMLASLSLLDYVDMNSESNVLVYWNEFDYTKCRNVFCSTNYCNG